MRRAALTLVLVCVSHPAIAAPCAGFTDVDSSSAFCANVAWMKNRGITLGCTATLYCPNDFVTRLQMAAFMYRLGYQNSVLQGGNAFGATAVLGTTDFFAVEMHSGGLRVMRYEPNSNAPTVIGGHAANNVTAGVYGATIGGGGDGALPNRVTDNHGTVGGGRGSIAGNEAGSTDDASYATVGGGGENTAGGWASTIGGGLSNFATGGYSTVAGGFSNTASGHASAVPGGFANSAGGNYSFAAGINALAGHHRSFVWGGDGMNNTFSVADGDFVVYAPYQVRLYAGPLGSGGCVLANGTTGWQCASDRALKENFTRFDTRELLQRLAAIPITRWTAKAVPDVWHIGPTAQDFRAAFGLGSDDVTIASTDAQGVALAAIQGLHRLVDENEAAARAMLREKDAAIEAQSREIAELKDRLVRLELLLRAERAVLDAPSR